MAAGRKLRIPKTLLEQFKTEMRIVLPGELVGLWPIDPGILRDPEFVGKLLKDKDFTQNYEIAIVARTAAR